MHYQILLVEDDPMCQKLYSDILEDAGYNVATADNVDNALEYLGTELPHLVITDINMPGRSGAELILEIRKDPRLCDMTVLILTAKDTPLDHEYLLKMGGDAFVSKIQPANVFLTTAQGLLRRLEMDKKVLIQGKMMLDKRTGFVHLNGSTVKTLGKDEFEILFLLAGSYPKTVSISEANKTLAIADSKRDISSVLAGLKAKLPSDIAQRIKPSDNGYIFSL